MLATPWLRYPECEGISSTLDPLEDLLTWLEFCTSKEFLVRTLEARHGFTPEEAARRSETISAHVECALSYIRQALDGPDVVAFLPLYYAVLNLLKVYVLAGPHWQELETQRTHGASYVSISDPATNLLFDERITLHPKGALSLFYKTVTEGREIVAATNLRMAEIYPLIQSVSAEYKMVTGEWSTLVPVHISSRPCPNDAS